jgi:DNA-3-methyladenine glycosylase
MQDALVIFCDRPARLVAPQLLGATFMLGGVGGIIVETEAYEPDDPASHSYGGPTARNAAMFGPPGRAYVYRSYGIHWCFNVVCRSGSAVLVRALQPTAGLDVMMERRGTTDPRALTSGPGKLTQALALSRDHDCMPLDRALLLSPAGRQQDVTVGPRIGITKATERPWRFGVTGSLYLSKPFPRPVAVSIGATLAR